MTNYSVSMESPIGILTLVSDGEYLLSLSMETFTKINNIEQSNTRPISILCEAKSQLEAYFDGKLKSFDLPLQMDGTQFQQKVWGELKKIPYGETINYGELASRVGNPKASRAVGMANHNNPIGIIVPCHRVIGADGKLTGYAGGLWRKEKLLELEGSLIKQHQLLID
jgi:methylated-DNA-[protein]-cysteine S-methyltransferase